MRRAGSTYRRFASDTHGATIVLALFLLLFCLLLAAVIIGAALGNATKVEGRHQQRQAYLTLSSAAQLVADGLGEMSYTGVVYTPGTLEGDCGQTHAAPDDSSTLSITEGDESINDILTDKVETLVEAVGEGKALATEETFAIEVDSLNSDTYDVTVTMTMNEDFDLQFVFAVPEVDGAKQCRDITLVYEAASEVVSGTEGGSHAYTSGGTSSTCAYQFTKTTTTISWATEPEID